VSIEAQRGTDLDSQPELARIEAVKRRHERALLSKANVVGVGTGFRHKGGRKTDTPALVVLVKKKVPPTQLSADDLVPSQIDGVPVDVQEVGDLRAQ